MSRFSSLGSIKKTISSTKRSPQLDSGDESFFVIPFHPVPLRKRVRASIFFQTGCGVAIRCARIQCTSCGCQPPCESLSMRSPHRDAVFSFQRYHQDQIASFAILITLSSFHVTIIKRLESKFNRFVHPPSLPLTAVAAAEWPNGCPAVSPSLPL